ncbi:MAG: 3-phosphoshikimate 1-carboxyvinyltransferase [Oscillospiraceae bacterium]|jgi:3-phosphoshikimate 1-carboxyvinyltransferase|nr:3-phosphoshikimate 1-carboxyvinyltransferase [Oscillospiraceae bacterium]
MDIKITPQKLTGEIAAITSKSAAHRALICAALSKEKTRISFRDNSKDISATIDCLSAMGAGITGGIDFFDVSGITQKKNAPVIDCKESGSTFRFLLPLSAILCNNAKFIGEGRLPERPIADLLNTLRANGVNFSADKLPFEVSGELKNGEYILPGNISSQFVSGLLFALPLLSGDSIIRLTSPLESKAYADMTVNMLKNFGIGITQSEDGYIVKGGQKYQSCPEHVIKQSTAHSTEVENDWSNAAFFLAAGALSSGGKGVCVTGLDMDSAQGDKKIVKLLKEFGADVEITDIWSGKDKKTMIFVSPNELEGLETDVSEIPDLLPILAVISAFAKGQTTLYNASRLRLKESDRLSSVCEMLRALGADAEEKPDALIITGGGNLKGGIADSKGDHRIAMSAAVCACFCEGEVIIKGAEAVEKSYPRFFEDFAKLGGNYVVCVR